MAIILTKTSEFYMTTSDRILPHSLATPGYMIGIPRAIHDMGSIPISALSWNLNAGASSLFMLSPINNKTHHAKLQDHYAITIDAPLSLKDHRQVFVELAKAANSNWCCEIIYFPRKWINE